MCSVSFMCIFCVFGCLCVWSSLCVFVCLVIFICVFLCVWSSLGVFGHLCVFLYVWSSLHMFFSVFSHLYLFFNSQISCWPALMTDVSNLVVILDWSIRCVCVCVYTPKQGTYISTCKSSSETSMIASMKLWTWHSLLAICVKDSYL